MFLIDTSAWISALRKNPNEEIKSRVDMLLVRELVATTGIIVLEIAGAARTAQESQRLLRRLQSLHYVESGRDVWDRAAKLSFDLRRKGVTIPPTDTLMAACALTRGAVVMHADSHFDLIARRSDLTVESVVHLLRQASTPPAGSR